VGSGADPGRALPRRRPLHPHRRVRPAGLRRVPRVLPMVPAAVRDQPDRLAWGDHRSAIPTWPAASAAGQVRAAADDGVPRLCTA